MIGKKAEQEVVHETFLKLVIGIGLLIASVMLLFALLDIFVEKPDFATKYGFERFAAAIEEAPRGKEVFLPLFINGDKYSIVTNGVQPECRRRCLCLCSNRPDASCVVIDKKCFDDPLQDKSEGKSLLANPLKNVDYFSSETENTVNRAIKEEETPEGKRVTIYTAIPVFTVRIFKENNNILLQSFPKVTSYVIPSQQNTQQTVLSEESAAEAYAYCTESDTKIDGKDLTSLSDQIFVLGESKGYEKEANTVILAKDMCKDEHTLFEYTCNFQDPLYAQTGIILKKEYACERGCENGACVLPEDVTLQDLTSS